MEHNYVALDLETTGLDPKTDRIIEIGAARIRDDQVTATMSRLVNPRRALEPRVMELTGITEEMLSGQPQIDEVLPQLLEFLGDDILLGHNILFDYSFVKRAVVYSKTALSAGKKGSVFQKKALDTLRIARICHPELPSKSLGPLCEYYQIPLRAHRALDDAIASHELYRRLCTGFAEATDYDTKQLVYQVKKEGPMTSAQRERLARMYSYCGLSLPTDYEELTKNEASRRLDKLSLQYGRMP